MGPTKVLRSFAMSALALAALAGCGSSTPSANPPASPTPSSSSPSSNPTTPFQRPTASPTGVQDLPVTDAIRAQLVAAGAKEKGLAASDFVGLEKGFTYYAYDPATQTYWAGAALRPSPSSTPAQVSTQDDGSYTLFHRAGGGAWVAVDTGMAGTAPGNGKCGSATPPAGVLTAWGWPPNTCHAPGA